MCPNSGKVCPGGFTVFSRPPSPVFALCYLSLTAFSSILNIELQHRKYKMVKGRKWVLKRHFEGNPKPEDFDLVEEELPALKENEIQYRSLFLSVDPYMRPYTMRMTPPFTMIGSSVAVVEETRFQKK